MSIYWSDIHERRLVPVKIRRKKITSRKRVWAPPRDDKFFIFLLLSFMDLVAS